MFFLSVIFCAAVWCCCFCCVVVVVVVFLLFFWGVSCGMVVHGLDSLGSSVAGFPVI